MPICEKCAQRRFEGNSLVGVLGDGAEVVELVGEDAEAVLPLGEHDGPLQVLGPWRALCHAEQVGITEGRMRS